MSFIQSENHLGYEPGYFLKADELCERESRTIPQSMATTAADGSKYVPAGTPFPSNNSSAVGIVYEDVDVSTGAMPGSVVTKGTIYTDLLPVDLDSDAETALAALGFKLIAASPSVTRPY